MTHPNAGGYAANSYVEQNVRAADPLSLVVQIYEIAVRQLAAARIALAHRNWAEKGKAIGRVSECISLLQNTLDKDAGGEVAANLDRLYSYFQTRLSHAHLQNDGNALEELSGHVKELLEAWSQAKQRQAAPPGGGGPAHAENNRSVTAG